jgi:hypothetical protein
MCVGITINRPPSLAANCNAGDCISRSKTGGENLDLIWMATVKQVSGFTAEKIRLATTFVSEPRAAPLRKWQLCSAAADLERITGVIHSERKLVLPNGWMGTWAKGVGRPF